MSLLKIGMIGCGGFAKTIYSPIIKNAPQLFKVIATCDVVQPAADNLKNITGAEYATTDAEKVLDDKNIDAVFITTRHDTHADLSVKAAEAGKHVVCEKPMALNYADCLRIAEAVKKSGIKYTVGYNRGLAPLVRKAKEMLSTENSKRIIYHRLQNTTKPNHWLHDKTFGGGRIIGEGVHILDLLCELINAEPITIYAAGGVFITDEKVEVPDTASVTLTFADGSVGTTLITSRGNDKMPKEVTEIYSNRKAVYINDFTELNAYGFATETITEKLAKGDKGWEYELHAFADAVLNKKEPPNGVNKAIRGALLSYRANESIAIGKPVAIHAEEYTIL
ncbi:MAG: Gfo/Idh/MocA family oxidoreductase [Elusimicrobiota bacterium]